MWYYDVACFLIAFIAFVLLMPKIQRMVFKTMTADNGPEFETFSKFESLGTKIYFTHPYSSWERPQNERHNGLLLNFIPKGISIEFFTDENILNMADELNQRPCRISGYHSPTELFDMFLDEIYSIDNVSRL